MSKKKQLDPRIKRTLQLIRDALISLIHEKGFEHITVRNITERAEINRATFYHHFQDKHDLLKRMTDELMLDFLTAIQLSPDFEATEFNWDVEQPPPSFIRQFEH